MEQYYGYKIEVDEKELDDIFCEIEKARRIKRFWKPLRKRFRRCLSLTRDTSLAQLNQRQWTKRKEPKINFCPPAQSGGEGK